MSRGGNRDHPRHRRERSEDATELDVKLPERIALSHRLEHWKAVARAGRKGLFRRRDRAEGPLASRDQEALKRTALVRTPRLRRCRGRWRVVLFLVLLALLGLLGLLGLLLG